MQNIFSIEGKVVVVTGSTGILGGAMATSLAEAGAKVGILGRSEEKVSAKVQELKNQNLEAIGLVADVGDQIALEEANEKIVGRWGKVDILINAAGGNIPGATIPPDKSVLDVSIADLRQVIDLNYIGTVLPTQVFVPSMIKAKKGHIINVSSVSAQKPLTRVMGYSSSKAAIENYTKWLSVELAQKYGEGLRVNAIAPGFFLTRQNKTLLLNDDGSLTDRGATIISQTPMKRFGTPDELVGTLIWLCSDASRFVTGTVVHVDGGFTAFSGV